MNLPERKGAPRVARRPRRVPVTPDVVLSLLAPLYGPFVWQARMAPLDELIFTVLTQHTSDLNASRAYEEMRRRYPDWDDVVAAPVAGLADAIRSGGLADQKSVRIQQILAEVKRRSGALDLRFLGNMPLGDARGWLRALPGVGPKTAAVVLAFAFGMPAMPVDTHIHRVSGRLGFISKKTTADQAHGVLEAMVRPEDRFAMHVALITHGRRTCKALRPLCGECVLAGVCPSRKKFVARSASSSPSGRGLR